MMLKQCNVLYYNNYSNKTIAPTNTIGSKGVLHNVLTIDGVKNLILQHIIELSGPLSRLSSFDSNIL